MRTKDLAFRVREVALSTAVVAVLCLGLPLALTIRVLVFDDQAKEVEQIAVTTAAKLSVDPPTALDRPELPRQASQIDLAFYGPQGQRIVGTGPNGADPVAKRAAGGVVATQGGPWTLALSGPAVIAAAPVTDGSTVVGVVWVSSDAAPIWLRTLGAWAALVSICLVALAASLALARRSAARLGDSVERLRDTAVAIGDGDLSRCSPPSGILELDEVGEALTTTAMRLSELLHRERALGAAASHQLRTPLMRLQLLLDSADITLGGSGQPDRADLIREAAHEVQTLRTQLEELLSLTRERSENDHERHALDLAAVLEQVCQRHNAIAAAHERRLVVGLDEGLPAVVGSTSAVGHALDVLVDNAVQHGQGTVRVWARETVGTVAIDVTDEGQGFAARTDDEQTGSQSSAGLGLGLAAALVQAQSGRLVLPGAGHAPCVSIILSPYLQD
ncbi:sensor histidine kinase [Tessaracoccus antarcticus]|uniref:sensor histidine kinase n=1 Tax=Tessaracoccus antarcticus TaxID=2479848 RepID=UPI0011C4A971|nr:HAMP domain-containing sensor histidine kinase [Tessaracoccus antarcticus]